MTILIITDTATHPVVAGNRARIVALARLMREQGHRVECLFLPRQVTPYDEAEARVFWGDGYHTWYRPPCPGLVEKIGYRFRSMLKQRKSKVALPKPENYDIDDWYREEWHDQVKEVVDRIQPDAVMVEYVYMSKALEAVPDGVLKIIDTHDKFTGRAEVYRAQGKEPVFFYTTEAEEARGLRRADRVIAISDVERDFFEKISGVPTYYIPHPVEVNAVGEPSDPVIGFLGSNNDVNRMGIEWFLGEIWPEVRAQIPEARLRIGGGIGDYLESRVSGMGVELPGKVDLGEFYGSVSVVVNPLLGGTGQKIKLIEALGYGKPVVTTRAGASGLSMDRISGCQIESESSCFARMVVDLLSSDRARVSLSRAALLFCHEYNDRIQSCLCALLDCSSPRSEHQGNAHQVSKHQS